MTYYNPNIPLLSNPVGVDREIQALQEELGIGLSWLEYVYGRAFLGVAKEVRQPNYLYPAVYKGNKNYYDASPNDNLRSQAFFYLDGMARPTTHDVGEYLKFTQPVSLIVWGRLDKVNTFLGDPFSDEHFGSYLLQTILNTIRKNRSFKIKSIVDNGREVFAEFGIRNRNPSLFYHPYFCYRINMDVAFEEECEADLTNIIDQSVGLEMILDGETT
jgi:hypothetical protein